ncbi:MAG: (Fe-S)-binding protein [Anaerolineales bacterium]|nr:(Fe-S)-binding protein [Anaerolineales bacterium]MCB8968896.1 (Fe-S)-binding protein [Ardenticatenaceae bacterium]
MVERESPQGKRVSLFVTCMVDMLYPDTGMSVVDVLTHLGVEVDFPMGQTCCGQPAFNAGYRQEARQVAIQFLKAFKDAAVIVTPSGSCGAMVRHEYPRLFADDPLWGDEARRLANITWEFTEFIVDGLGITDLNGRLPTPQTIAFHDSCHGLRLLGLKQASRALVGNLENATIVEWDNSETCCGFGGLFSVKMADVSGAMLAKKIDHIEQSEADAIITGDVSCLTHMNNGLQKQGKRPRVKHIADLLAEGIRDGKSVE